MIRVNNNLFPGAPDVIYCTVIERRIGSETIDDTWNYHLKNYNGPPGTHTTYHADGWWHEPDVWLGKYSLPGYPPDDDAPELRTRLNPDIQYVYNVIILPAPFLSHPPPPIAWTKTVNAIKQPKNWWHRTPQGLITFIDRVPPEYVNVFNNFPHPCGYKPYPPYWPNPDDTCHVDWLKRSLWPQYLDEAVCANMLLDMLIDDWGTWEELFSEHIQTIPRWVL